MENDFEPGDNVSIHRDGITFVFVVDENGELELIDQLEGEWYA